MIDPEQGFAEAAVFGNFQVPEFMDDDVFAECQRLGQEAETE